MNDAPRPAGLAERIPLSDAQLRELEAIKTRIDAGQAGYPEAYGALHGWIASDPRAQADGRDFWFEQARGINANDSLSADFIRTHTRIGLDLKGVPLAERLPMQELSNAIGQQVVQDIIDTRAVPALPEMLARDIQVALTEGKTDLGGWGGSFYYWDQPYIKWDREQQRFIGFENPDGSVRSIGDEIERLGLRERMIETGSRTMAALHLNGQIDVRNPEQVQQMLGTARDAGAPLTVKGDIFQRAGREVAEVEIDRTKVAWYQSALDAMRENVVDPAVDAARGAVRGAVRGAIDEVRERLPFNEPQAAVNAVPPRLDEPGHPRHAQFTASFDGIAAIDAQHGREPDAGSRNLAGALVAHCAERGLERVEDIVLSKDGARVFAIEAPGKEWYYEAWADVATGRAQAIADSTRAADQFDLQRALEQQQSLAREQERAPALGQEPLAHRMV